MASPKCIGILSAQQAKGTESIQYFVPCRLAYHLALKAGIEMAESRLEHVAGKYHTFFTKRFDRDKQQRVHFASAMTMTGRSEV